MTTKNKLNNMTEKETYLNYLKHPVSVSIGVLILALFVHPKVLNLHSYFRSTEKPIPMNFVSNFYLWTRYNLNDAEKMIAGATDSLMKSNFRPKKTYLIIHGFTRSGYDDWIIKIKNALLFREDCNVVSVDWESGTLTVGYYVIQARVPSVGEDISKLINFLQAEGYLESSQVHLIGHSLGAHIAGFAGLYINGTVSRITGLDPAGLGYNGASPADRLDKSDASFVDVIHTHGCYTILNHWTDCYGSYDNMGHVDFWPNGGENQPACNDRRDTESGIPEESNCNHAMAYAYFGDSIKYYPTSTRYLARKCPSYELFNNGSCDCIDHPQYMGFNANSQSEGVFYLNTSHILPYGLLEPHCSASEYSFLKVFGLSLCLVLVAFGVYDSYLAEANMKSKKHSLCSSKQKEDART